MTLTQAQVQDLQTTVKADLEAGTFSLYGSTPMIHTEKQKKSSKNIWIEVLETTGNITQAVNGAVILLTDRCKITINTPSREALDKLYADVLNILTSSRGYALLKTQDKPLRSKYNKTITIQLKDI